MKCAHFRELLAPYVEGDVSAGEAADITRHLRECAGCSTFCQELRETQLIFGSLRNECVSESALAGVRHAVLSQTADPKRVLTLRVVTERIFFAGFRKPRLAAACFALFAVLSVSILAQLKGSETNRAVFDSGDALLLPDDYREWISLGSTGPAEHVEGEKAHSVYINPEAYQAYSRTGAFPDGTVLILEVASLDSVNVEASVKDFARFGGWGYFSFTDEDGTLRDRAHVFPEARGCRSCHEQQAETDHVFTQFYPVLRSAG
jgi:hypothetical protein